MICGDNESSFCLPQARKKQDMDCGIWCYNILRQVSYTQAEIRR